MAQNLVTGPIQDLKVSLNGLPSKVDAKSVYLLSLSGNNQMLGVNPHTPMSLFEIYFTCKTKDLKLKDFKPDQDIKLEIKVTALGDSTNGNKKSEITYKLAREVYSLSSMETFVFTNDDYLYKLVLGHPDAPFANLTATVEAAREGSVKDVLQEVLTAANITKVKLDGLKSAFLTSSKRWYYQRESHWQFLVNELLTPNGLTAYLNEDNTLVFLENGKDYKDADFSPWVTAGSPIKNNNSSMNVIFSALHTLRTTETYMPIKAINVSSHKADSKDTIQKGVHPKDDKMFSYLHGNFGEGSDLNKAVAQQLFENITWKEKIFTGEFTIPSFLAKKIDRPKDADGKEPTDKTLIPVALNIHCSFYNPNMITAPNFNLQSFTGFAPNTFSFNAVLVPDKVMPQLTYAPRAEAPIFLEGVVVDAGGKNTGKPAPNKNMLRVGLFAENKKGQNFTVVEMQITEDFSMENSTPYPGTKVLVAYLPSLGRFYCVGKIRMNAFSNDILLATSTADSPAEKSFITIDNDQSQITLTNEDKTIKIAKAEIMFSTNKSSSISINDKEGIEITSSDKITSTAKTDMENNAKTLTNKISGDLENTVGGNMKNTVSGNIENKAAKISNK